MKKVGFIGWRGMVGSVLMERLQAEDNFKAFESYFFSTSQVGEVAPALGTHGHSKLLDAYDIDSLLEMDILVSCQGGDYTKKIHGSLREKDFTGYWIDAASTLRMEDSAIIILDPINDKQIDLALNQGIRDFVGGNCTVSLMLLALHGLFEENLIEWISSMTYQAASGAGAKNMEELILQMDSIGSNYQKLESSLKENMLTVEKVINKQLLAAEFPTSHFGHPLALNLLPWIDSELPSGQSREEWKAQAEANKILATQRIIPIDGTCVRVGAMRCHSQGLTIKLNQDISMSEIEEKIANANSWVKLIPNNKEATLKHLTPQAVSGTLDIAIGRLRKSSLGPEFINAFTVGDQLLWGAAEPIRRMLLKIV